MHGVHWPLASDRHRRKCKQFTVASDSYIVALKRMHIAFCLFTFLPRYKYHTDDSVWCVRAEAQNSPILFNRRRISAESKAKSTDFFALHIIWIIRAFRPIYEANVYRSSTLNHSQNWNKIKRSDDHNFIQSNSPRSTPSVCEIGEFELFSDLRLRNLRRFWECIYFLNF